MSKLKYAVVSEHISTGKVELICAHENKKPCLAAIKRFTNTEVTDVKAEEGLVVGNLKYRLIKINKLDNIQ